MKAFYFFALLFLSLILPSQSIAQDVISNVLSSGNQQRHILQEYNGESYVVKISSLDSLYTYRFDDGEPTHLHTSHSIGAYTDYFQYHYGKWLFYSRPDGAAAYNFIKDEFEIFEYDDVLTYSSWSVWQKGVIRLRQTSSDFTVATYQIFDENLNELETVGDFSRLYDVSDDYFIFSKREEENIVISIQNRTTGEVRIAKTFHEDVQHVISENHLIYYDEVSKEVRRHSFDIDLEEVVHTVDIELTQYGVYQTRNQIYFQARNSDLGIFYAFVINKQDQKSVTIEGANLESSSIGASSMKDILIYEKAGDHDSVHLYNFIADRHVAFRSNQSPKKCLKIADRYVIYYDWITPTIYDAQEDSYSVFSIQLPLSYRLKVESIKVGDNYLIDLGSDIEEVEDLVFLNAANTTLEYSHIIPQSRRGLLEKSEIIRLGEDIFVVNDDHLYVIKDDSLYQLDQYEIVKNDYRSHKVNPNGLLWAEKNDDTFTFYKYFNGEKKELVTILDDNQLDLYNLIIANFVDGDETILINGRSGFEEKTILINKETMTEIISQDEGFSSLGIFLFYQGHYYYSRSAQVFRLDEDGNEALLDFSAPIVGLGAHIIFDDKLFLVNDNGIFSVQDGEVIEEHIFNQSSNSIKSFELLNGFLTLTTQTEGLIYKDDIWQLYGINPDYWHSEFYGTYVQAIESAGTNLTYTRLLNMETDEYIELPIEISSLRLVDAFIYKEEQYLIAIDGLLPNYIVKIFKMSDDFTSGEEVTSFETVGWGIKANYKSYNDEGLLYIGNKLFLMNESLEFIPLENVNGDNESVYIQEEDGTFYFIALHSEKGRQVFSAIAFSQRVSTININFSDFEIYPNPAQNMLMWKSDQLQNEVQLIDIYDIQGRKIFTTTDQSIDISQLHEGMHVIMFTGKSGEHLGSIEFVKIE